MTPSPNVSRTVVRLLELFTKAIPDLPPAETVARVIEEGTKHSQLLEAFEDQTSRLRDMVTEAQSILKRTRGAQ